MGGKGSVGWKVIKEPRKEDQGYDSCNTDDRLVSTEEFPSNGIRKNCVNHRGQGTAAKCPEK